MKTITATTIAFLLGALSAASLEAQLPKADTRVSGKTQTSDPYFSTPAQSASEQTSTWSPPRTTPTSTEREIWKSLSRKTSKPVQRIDFSQLQVNPAVKADLLKTASSWQAPKTNKALAKASVKKPADATNLNFSAPATEKSQSTSFAALQPIPAGKAALHASLAPLPVAAKVNKGTPLSPLLNSVPASQATAQVDSKSNLKPIKPINPLGKPNSDFQPSVQQATYQQPIGGSFVPGQNIKKLGGRIKELRNSPPRQSNVTATQADQGYRVAESNSAYNSSPNYSGSGTRVIEDSSQSYNSTVVTGESFEPSRVVAIVGGDPIFVGDMLFEINQLIEKHMKGAPEEAKVHQRGNLIKRLLPKYVDQKMLFLSTTGGLPSGANLEDVIAQAEKTFNDQALPAMMKSSGITSTAQFDGNLRAQGSSIRQMRRSWAKDQVSRYLLAEKVKVNQDVTHHELLNEYRNSYDSYAHIAKCRWEKIEVKFDKAGGRFAAKDKMDDIYQRLVHGGNFQAIAKKESHGFKASKGGQHDWTNRGSLVSKKVDEAIFTLPQGRLSQIIETKNSFLVVRVKERVDAHHTPFDEAQAGIKKKIINARRDEEFKKYLRKIRTEIPVEYPEG